MVLEGLGGETLHPQDFVVWHPAPLAKQVGVVNSPENLGQKHGGWVGATLK